MNSYNRFTQDLDISMRVQLFGLLNGFKNTVIENLGSKVNFKMDYTKFISNFVDKNKDKSIMVSFIYD